MKLIHNITISVFVKEGEKQAVEQMMHQLVPFDFEKEKIDLRIERQEAYEGGNLYIFSLKVHTTKHVRMLLEKIWEKLSDEDKELIAAQKESRVDDEACFFFRLDKPRLLEGEFRLTEGGDCFHFRIKMAAYPVNKEKGLQAVDALIKEFESYGKSL